MTPPALSRFSLAVVLASSMSLFACGGVQDEPSAQTASAGDDLITQTVVHTNPDGTQSVTTYRLTRAQQAAEVAARMARDTAAASGDGRFATQKDALDTSACSGSAIWVFDNTNQTGNEICFDGLGAVTLANYCRITYCNAFYCSCLSNWAGAVRSFWAGQWKGYWYNPSNFCTYYYAKYERDDTVDACTQSAPELHQYDLGP